MGEKCTSCRSVRNANNPQTLACLLSLKSKQGENKHLFSPCFLLLLGVCFDTHPPSAVVSPGFPCFHGILLFLKPLLLCLGSSFCQVHSLSLLCQRLLKFPVLLPCTEGGRLSCPSLLPWSVAGRSSLSLDCPGSAVLKLAEWNRERLLCFKELCRCSSLLITIFKW